MKSVMMAYLILVLHVVLLMGLGVLVFFFRGIVHYMLWIVLFGAIAILASGYWFYRRMKAEGRSFRDTLNSPLFRNKTVEVSLLGGLAQFRVGHSNGPPLLGDGRSVIAKRSDHTRRVRASQTKDIPVLMAVPVRFENGR